MFAGLSLGWIVALAIGALVIFRIGFAFGRMASESERIMPIAPTRVPPDLRARIDEELRNGNKVAAIKLLRQGTGCGLAEAKKTVDSYELPRQAAP